MAKKKNADGTEVNLVKVRVKGTQPVSEGGKTYLPPRGEPDGKGSLKAVPGDEFEVEAERVEALGESVEVVK